MMEVVEELRKEGVKGVHYVTVKKQLYTCLSEAFSVEYMAF